MTKASGLGDQLYVAGYDLGGDINSLGSISGGPAPWETPDITASAMSRIGLLRTGQMEMTCYFNKATGRAHPRFSSLPTADVICTYGHGTTRGNQGAALVAKQIDYAVSRPADGSLTADVSMQSNGYGLEWGVQLTAGKQTDTVAGNGTSVDLGTASPGAFGAQAYLQVFSFTGTSCTVKIQESSDNGVGDAFADVVGGGFTAATGITSQRIATAAINVERYLRVVTTGTFSECTFNVIVHRNETAVSF